MFEVVDYSPQAFGFAPPPPGAEWSNGLDPLWLHNVCDVLIWLACLAIPAVLLYFTVQRRLPFARMLWMFSALFVSFGFTHFFEVLASFQPVYRASAVVKLLTALISWATVLGLLPLVPRVLALRTPHELECEIQERQRAEELLQQARAELEARVQQRTTELEAAKQALQAEAEERARAEAEREALLVREQRARAGAEDANRVKEDFLSNLSHELRTPLNAMLSWLYLLRSGQLDAKLAAHGLEVLDSNTRAEARLIDDLLDVSSIIRGNLPLEFRPTDLRPVVDAALDTVRLAAEARQIDLRLEADPDLGPVAGDPARLRQVVWNLLSNAVKFTPPSGRVSVLLRRGPDDVVLQVCDTGVGISAELLPHVFERFSQGNHSSTRFHGGLGLGLAIVRHLVELHGGTVEAESAGRDQGATFTVRLPTLRAKPEARGTPAPGAWEPADRVALSGLRVLVVDDDLDARGLAGVVLGRCGATVNAVGSVREALDSLAREVPDVLLSALAMPGEDGYELIRAVRARPPDQGGLIPAVALTAATQAEEGTRALATGFQVYAPKPIDPDELVVAVLSLARCRGRCQG